MEIDTGSSSSLISEKQFNYQKQGFIKKIRGGVIQRLRTYSAEDMLPRGVANLNVKYKGKMYKLRVLVVLGSGPSLLRGDWLESLPINLSGSCNQIKRTD